MRGSLENILMAEVTVLVCHLKSLARMLDKVFFINGDVDVEFFVTTYPDVIYSLAHYRHIPLAYPRVDAHNPYLITRYDGTVINPQPKSLSANIRLSIICLNELSMVVVL
ncbi:hypothetical protein SDJN03_21557, partial [Cucurbita argyrosperma subsp. sororia]